MRQRSNCRPAPASGDEPGFASDRVSAPGDDRDREEEAYAVFGVKGAHAEAVRAVGDVVSEEGVQGSPIFGGD
ncbi:hypothetical protein [Asaia platycodi]|uniref:hypothetical protein n=1 Tax=Asaia platycodi TaxID=610243 RepID=UPI001F5ADD48|nr:hypothetical protein [Asaia platycodi]